MPSRSPADAPNPSSRGAPVVPRWLRFSVLCAICLLIRGERAAGCGSNRQGADAAPVRGEAPQGNGRRWSRGESRRRSVPAVLSVTLPPARLPRPKRGSSGKGAATRGRPAKACGGAEGNRTPDLCSAIAALSHLSYGPRRLQACKLRGFCLSSKASVSAERGSSPRGPCPGAARRLHLRTVPGRESGRANEAIRCCRCWISSIGTSSTC
jgi:hypothetical protein